MNKNKAFLVVVVLVAVAAFVGLLMMSKDPKPAATSSSVTKADPTLLVREHSPQKGAMGAKVSIVEFLDPECEACRLMHPIVKSLLNEYEGKVSYVIRYMPFHGNSKYAASALEEAREQGKYDEAMDLLFFKLPEWGDHHQPRPELIPEIVSSVGVKKSTLEEKAVVAKHGWRVDKDQEDGKALGVKHTPTFYVNGEMLHDLGYEPLKMAIEKALAE